MIADERTKPSFASVMPTSDDEPSWARYRIGRGETGVLTFEPYKSALLPLWRFRTPELARKSSSDLWTAFLNYENEDDFVGMDMARKFLQMGMTRARRYANHRGGRKYVSEGGKESGEVLERNGDGWKDSVEWKEKDEASRVFKAVWEEAKASESYQLRKAEFLKRQKEWDRQRKAEFGVGSRKR